MADKAPQTEKLNHPIAAVAGKPVQLSHLLDLKVASTSPDRSSSDNAFSVSTRSALRRSAHFPATESLDGRPVVDSSSYLKAVLGAASDEHKAEATAIANILAGPNEDRLQPLRDALGGRGQKPIEDNLARCIASPDLTEMLADAARLAFQVSNGQMRINWRHALVACLKRLPAQQALWSEGFLNEPQPDKVFSEIRNVIHAWTGAAAV